ncbi:restriction endonuclease subunit S [Legionella pneumophila serogroup 1]
MERLKYKLSEICNITMGQAPKGSSYNDVGEGYPLIAGAGDFGLNTPKPKKHTVKPTRLSVNDDLILCIRATIGDLNWSDNQYCLGRGVAGLRPIPNKLDKNYLWHFLQSYKEELQKKGTGSTFKQISRSHIEEIEVPLPSLEEQKRIAAILDKADAVRRKRQQAIELSEQLLRSVFLDMFGDPVTNSKGWKQVSFNSVGTLERGKSKHRPRNDPILLGGAYPLIQTGDVANSKGYITNYCNTYSEIGLKQSKIWPIGTLCITIAANIAKTAILEIEACFPDSIVGFQSNGLVTIEYVQHWLGFLQKIIEDSAPESAQKNINLEILRTLKIPLPDIEAQKKFSDIVKRINKQKKLYFSFEKSTNELFSSLAQKAFNGELSKRFENELA